MKALLRPLFVGGLSIAIAGMSLLGASSVALAATPPVITTWSINAPVYEGARPTITVTFTDPDLTDRHTVDISWGDGSFDSYTLPVGDRSFAVQKTVPYLIDSPTALTVQITVSDPIFSTSRFLSVTVLNAVPSISAFSLSASAIDAGQTLTATGTFADPGTADTHTVRVDWGDLSPTTMMNLAAAVYSFTTTAHTYAAAGNFTVTVTVTDDAGASATATATVSVHTANQPPTIVSFVVTAGSEGGSSTLALTFADPDPLDTHTVSVAWGDGSTSAPVVLAANLTTFAASHVYADTGTYTVVLTLTDSAGHTVTASASVSPTNVAPVVGSLSLSPSSVTVHQTLTVSATFTDPGTADTFAVTVNWGDGNTSPQSLAAGTRNFSASHGYVTSGTFVVTVTVTDRDGGTGSQTASVVVTATASDVLDQMSALVQSFNLDPNTERWLLKKLDDLRASLVSGNGEVCSSTGTLSKILGFAQRTLSTDQYAALSALGANLQTAAGCTSPIYKGAVLSPTTTPTIVAPTTSGEREDETTDKGDTEKQDTRDIEKSERGEAERSGGKDSR